MPFVVWKPLEKGNEKDAWGFWNISAGAACSTCDGSGVLRVARVAWCIPLPACLAKRKTCAACLTAEWQAEAAVF